MSLPSRYPPMASYFRLSIIFLTLQILRHLPCWHNLLWPSRDHHRLYPIPIAPLVQYHVGDLSYDLWTTSLHFPFLVFSPYLMHSFVVMSLLIRYAHIPFYFRFSFTFPTRRSSDLDGAIRRRVSEIWDSAKVQRQSGAKQWDKMNLSLSSGGKLPSFSE